MMRNKYLLLAILSVVLFSSCERDSTEDVSTIVKVSFPTITLNGPELVILQVGASYTDAGAQLTDDITGQTSTIQPTSNNVNTAQPGLYLVSYSASNTYGFETNATRLVAVTSVTGTPDRSGTYLRPATGVNCIVTKVADGVYKVQNPGGAPGRDATIVYYVETEPNVFVCPTQPTADGPFAVININFTSTGASWNVVNAGYGTAVRTFVK